MVIKPSDQTFDRLMNYPYCQYMNKSHFRLSDGSNSLHEQEKMFLATLEYTRFSGDDPIMVFDFLTRFVEEADTLSVS